MMILNRDKHIEIIIFVENGINNEIAFQSFLHVKWFLQRCWQWRWYVITSAGNVFYRKNIWNYEEITHFLRRRALFCFSNFSILSSVHRFLDRSPQFSILIILDFKNFLSPRSTFFDGIFSRNRSKRITFFPGITTFVFQIWLLLFRFGEIARLPAVITIVSYFLRLSLLFLLLLVSPSEDKLSVHFVIVPSGILSPRNNPLVGGDSLSRLVSLKISLFRTRITATSHHLKFISHYTTLLRNII